MVYHDIDYSSLCYTEGPCPSILCVIVCTCWSGTPTPSLPHPSSPSATTSLSRSLWVCFCFIDRFVCVNLKTCLPFWDKCSGAGALGRPRGIGWRGRWVGGSGWGIHVYTWLIHANVWQNPLQYCKVISLQLIKINGKKKCSPFDPAIQLSRRLFSRSDLASKGCVNKKAMFIIAKKTGSGLNIKRQRTVKEMMKLLVEFYVIT